MQPILIPLLLISSAPALAGAESAPLPAGEIANPDVVLEEKAIKGDAQAQAELASLFDGKSSDYSLAVKSGREMSPARPRPGAIDICRLLLYGLRQKAAFGNAEEAIGKLPLVCLPDT